MMFGEVQDREALIEVEVFNFTDQSRRVHVIVDTGYNGHLTLPADLIASLKLPLTGQRRAKLADDRVVLVDVFQGSVLWHGAAHTVLVSQTAKNALVGMGLLEGSRLLIDAVDGGQVRIESLSSPNA